MSLQICLKRLDLPSTRQRMLNNEYASMKNARLPALSVRLLGVRRGLTGAAVAVLVGTTVIIAPLIDGFLFGIATAQTSNGPGGGGAGGAGPGGGAPGGGGPGNGGPGGGVGGSPGGEIGGSVGGGGRGGGAEQNTGAMPNRVAPANAPVDRPVAAPAMRSGDIIRPTRTKTTQREPVFSGNTEPASDPLSAEQEAQAIRSGWE